MDHVRCRGTLRRASTLKITAAWIARDVDSVRADHWETAPRDTHPARRWQRREPPARARCVVAAGNGPALVCLALARGVVSAGRDARQARAAPVDPPHVPAAEPCPASESRAWPRPPATPQPDAPDHRATEGR